MASFEKGNPVTDEHTFVTALCYRDPKAAVAWRARRMIGHG